jgi:hypothetical protein
MFECSANRARSGRRMRVVGARHREGGGTVGLWLLLIIAGVVLAILGFAGVGSALIWIGVIVLVVGLVMSFVGRGRASV